MFFINELGLLDGLKIVNGQYDNNVDWTCRPLSSETPIITGYSCWLCHLNKNNGTNFRSCVINSNETLSYGRNKHFSPPPPPPQITFSTQGLVYPRYHYTPSIKTAENEYYKPKINQTMIDRQRVEFLGSFACDFFKILGNSNRVCPNRPRPNDNG